MARSAAQIEASRRNSLRSTGPRTEAGRQKSRGNALKHGLTALVLRTPVDEKNAEEWPSRCPVAAGSSALDAAWLAEEVAVIGGRIERIGKILDRDRERAALRASTSWDEDRLRDAEALGSALDRRPSEIVKLLEETPQGCTWLIGRWAMLARVADLEGGWDADAKSLAFDLIGTPHAVRKGEPGQRIDADGRALEDPPEPLAYARSQSGRLIALRDQVAHLDEFDRDSAVGGLDESAGLGERRLRGYESALFRRLRWYLDRLAEGSGPSIPDNPAPDRPAPTVDAPGENEAKAEPEPESAPTIEANPDRVSRQDRKAQKVERRRLAADRKLARRLG